MNQRFKLKGSLKQMKSADHVTERISSNTEQFCFNCFHCISSFFFKWGFPSTKISLCLGVTFQRPVAHSKKQKNKTKYTAQLEFRFSAENLLKIEKWPLISAKNVRLSISIENKSFKFLLLFNTNKQRNVYCLNCGPGPRILLQNMID